MNSGFAASFHESLGGIRPDADNPGFKHFFLKPCFIPGLEWVKVSHRSPHGEIVSSWKREDGVISWSVTIPENTTAEIHLDAYTNTRIKVNKKAVSRNTISLPAGKHSISIRE
jgi:alpha-L-rhamnosidase